MIKITKLVVGAILVVVILAVVAVAIFVLTRDEAPEAVDLESTVARIEAADAEPSSASSTDNQSADSTVTTAPDDDSAAGDGTPARDAEVTDTGTDDTNTATTDQPVDLTGVWTVKASDDPGDLQGEPTVSFAGFRVDEVLDNIGDFTAVGRTAKVAGSIELSDTALIAATVEVQMDTLRTDNSFRDGRMYGALNTAEHPVATFVLAEPVELPAPLASGEPFSGTVHGDLTIKGVTNRVTFDLQAQFVGGDRIVAVGSSPVTFADYGVTAPTAPIVVSVEDHGIMEFQLILTR